MSNPFPLRHLALAAASVWCASALAQTADPAAGPAAVLRNVEQNLPAKPATTAVERTPAPASTGDFNVSKLVGVRVDSTFLADEIQAYWLPSLNKAVSANELSRFKAWVWEQLQAEGYLAYVLTKEEKSADGSVLVVQVRAPLLGKVTVASLDQLPDDEGSKPYANEVARRFAKLYTAGSPVDVQGMTARLSAISYDLPVVLEAVLRQPDAEAIDVVINMRLVPAEPGKLISGLVQANNYGLSAYGREQLLTQLRINGETPMSEVTLTGQASKGVRYFKGEATAPWIGKQSRGMGWFTLVESKSEPGVAQVRGATIEFGGGVHTLLLSNREGTVTSAVELGHRATDSTTSDSTTSGTTTADRTDNQLRLRLMTSMTPKWVNNYSADLGLFVGRIGIEDSLDTDPRNVKGHYQKLEFNGQARKTLSADKKWVGAVRWRAQAAWKNLDGYNQLSLGGVNGIRAYTSSDGVGDQGVQVSLDLTRQITDHLFVGVLYDTGRVKPNIKAVGTSQPASYSLSGAGFQMGGDYGAWSWIGTAAKGLDKTEPFAEAVSSDLREWRGSIAINYRF